LYGGRNIEKETLLSKKNIKEIYSHNIGLAITMSNHYFDENSYKKSYDLLLKHHKQGNSVVCTNDKLAKQIKKDFPLYKIKASLIKDLNSYDKVVKALELYDYIVLPPEMNDYDDFLKSLPSKEKIILFANTNCAYTCTSRICYINISKKISKRDALNYSCSKDIVPREQLGHTFFNIKKLKEFGFTYFKLVPSPSIVKKEKVIQNKESLYLSIIEKYKPIFYIFSFPKSGRTWFRYILANYLNIYFNLGVKIDLHSMFTLIPNDGSNLIKGIGAYRYVKHTRFPLIVASHKSLDTVDLNNKKIILLRNVYDVMVSEYFQHVYFLKKFDGTISEFIRQKNGSLYHYCKFINSIDMNNQDLLITYEMMYENITNIIKLSLEFLNIPIDNTIVNEAIELSTFEKMKESEQKNGIAGSIQKEYDTNSARVREGKINNYRQYLNEEDITYIKKNCVIYLSENSKNILNSMKIDYITDETI
jgi:alcohol sulfotransferase